MSNEEVSASVLFSRDAGNYDNLRRQLIPCFDDFYGTALKLVQEWQAIPTIDVLDVGAGTGMFSTIVRSKCSIGRLCSDA